MLSGGYKKSSRSCWWRYMKVKEKYSLVFNIYKYKFKSVHLIALLCSFNTSSPNCMYRGKPLLKDTRVVSQQNPPGASGVVLQKDGCWDAMVGKLKKKGYWRGGLWYSLSHIATCFGPPEHNCWCCHQHLLFQWTTQNIITLFSSLSLTPSWISP